MASAGTENLSPGYATHTREIPENMAITMAFPSLPVTQLTDKESSSGDPSPTQSCTSPSNCVDAFLADPSENGDTSSSSPQFLVKRSPMDKEVDNASCDQNQTEVLKGDLLQVHPHTPVSEQIDDSFCSKQGVYTSRTSQNVSISSKEFTAELHSASTNKHASGISVIDLKALYQTVEDPGSASSIAKVIKTNKGAITEQSLRLASSNVSIFTDSCRSLVCVGQHNRKFVFQQITDPSLVSKANEYSTVHNGKEIAAIPCHGIEDQEVQTVEAGSSYEFDCTFQLHPDHLQNIQLGDTYINTSVTVQMSSAPTRAHISYDMEVSSIYQLLDALCFRLNISHPFVQTMLILLKNIIVIVSISYKF